MPVAPRKRIVDLDVEPERVHFSVPAGYRSLLIRVLTGYPVTIKRIGDENGNEPIYLVEVKANGRRDPRTG